MEQLRRVFATIAKHLSGLNPTQKLLIGSLAVILVMTLFLVSQYAAAPTRVAPIPNLAPAELDRAASRLRLAGVTSYLEGGKLLVGAQDELQARAALLEDGFVGPGDKALLFENVLQRQSWTNSRQQNDKLYQVALQNELSRCLAVLENVKSAQVMMDLPQAAGFGPRAKAPTAAVTIRTRDGSPLGQGMVNAVAGIVAGSVSGLEVANIRVIDAAHGRQLRPTSDDDQLPTTYLEHASRVETSVRDKFHELLSYIPGVVVAVTAQVDVTRSKSEVIAYSPEKQGTISLEKEKTKTTTTTTETSSAGTPGPTANQTADITTQSGGTGSNQNSEESKVQNEVHVGQKTETVVDPKGYPTLVAVSVNVPRGYVASLVKPAAGAAPPAGAPAAGPTDAEVDQKFVASIKPMIVESLVPQLRALMVQSGQTVTAAAVKALAEEMISVSMIPAEMPIAATGGGLTGGNGGGGGGMLALGGGMMDKLVLGVLGVAAMGMMIMMVKKAGRKSEMPTAEELVGLPPALETTSDVIGEADAAQEALSGIEVDDSEMQSQQMLEQIGSLIKDNPGVAARLLNRWIETEE
ncbi:MAG: flagellar M-ring protein FliF C-terminal domain-containing protein [Phycisphaerales bacterium]